MHHIPQGWGTFFCVRAEACGFLSTHIISYACRLTGPGVAPLAASKPLHLCHLPQDALSAIASFLGRYQDVLRVSGVCRSLRAAVAAAHTPLVIEHVRRRPEDWWGTRK